MRDSLVRELRSAEQHGADPQVVELYSTVLVPFAELLEQRRRAGASAQQVVADAEIAAAAILGHLLLNGRPRGVSVPQAIGILCRNVERRVTQSLLAEGVFGPEGTA